MTIVREEITQSDARELLAKHSQPIWFPSYGWREVTPSIRLIGTRHSPGVYTLTKETRRLK
jgi:hypothetical protein